MLRDEFIDEEEMTDAAGIPHYKIDINIDEAKLNEDKNAATITPILGRIHSVRPTASSGIGTEILLATSVFVIGFYVGRGKPDYISSFLYNLVLEFCRLSPSNCDNVCTNGRGFTASLRCIIADGPMRSYLKRTKGHSGYWSCDRCIQKGDMVNRAILLKNVNAPKRTDTDFLTYHASKFSADDHLKDPTDISPFVEMNFPMVTGFVIDPMHTAVEGAFGRRLEGFIFVSGEGKLSSAQVAEADRRMGHFNFCRPYGFDRSVGKLSTCRNFKTHVKRNILYYFLYPLFKGILSDEDLEHIMLLQYGMLLLGSFNRKPVSSTNIAEAKKTFYQYSVGLTELGIPCRFVSHQVTHLWEDVQKYQCGVETNSAFPFESFQGFFRRCLRSGNLQAEQIRNRCIEKSKYQLPTTSCGMIIENKLQLTIEAKTLNKKSNKLLQLVHRGNRWPKKLVFTDFVLSDTFPNNVFLSNSFDAFVCVDIAIKNGITQIIAHKFLELVNAFTYPYISSRFHIFSGSNLSSVTFPMRPSDVFCKVFAIPLNPSPPISFENIELIWYLAPLLHTYENRNQ
jgi:hypothetical protein